MIWGEMGGFLWFISSSLFSPRGVEYWAGWSSGNLGWTNDDNENGGWAKVKGQCRCYQKGSLGLGRFHPLVRKKGRIYPLPVPFKQGCFFFSFVCSFFISGSLSSDSLFLWFGILFCSVNILPLSFVKKTQTNSNRYTQKVGVTKESGRRRLKSMPLGMPVPL